MYIKMIGLYGIPDQTAWFRLIGNGCFDFVSHKEYASDLNEEEVNKVMTHKDWYCKAYNAEMMFIEYSLH